MFTGIVEEVGRVVGLGPRVVEISTGFSGMAIGDSIAVSGVCLTVTRLDPGRFAAELSEETLGRTSLGGLAPGTRVNLERPVPVGGRLGGHVVQGHVDGTGAIRRIERRPGSVEMWFEPPPELQRYLVEKGSVAVDGVSLTVAGVEKHAISVALIPHTLDVTTLGDRAPGDRVNIEVDILAKYVESLLVRREP
jgi:riboflavin synthase